MVGGAHFTASARTDGRDWLIEAEEPLAGLQLRSGGELPGIVASPALLELVRKSRLYGLRLARPIRAQDDNERITAWAEVAPDAEGEGCRISLSNWQASPLPAVDEMLAEGRRVSIVRQLSELTARLGPNQEVLTVSSRTAELADTARSMNDGHGRPWTDFVVLPGNVHEQPLHWRLLDGVRVEIAGSPRNWTAHIIPVNSPEVGSAGFELLFLADEPPMDQSVEQRVGQEAENSSSVGRVIAPVLRQPVSRIIANAETIRSQLAGPLAEDYGDYAADIATAGEHLLALIDDLADLEVIESEQFTTAPDQIDLADCARRAAGLLSVRAREQGIDIDAPKEGESVSAIGEFRRVLQVLLNLISNAIHYSPEGSQIWLRVELENNRARIVVADQGEGLSDEQQAKVFEKFERLGRSGDGGSGLGLYISRRLARAMKGELAVESAPGQGARFTLELPADTSSTD